MPELSQSRLRKRKEKLYLTQTDIYHDHYPYKKKDDKHYIDCTTWNKVIKILSDVLLETLLNKGEVELPYRLGKLRLLKAKPLRKPVDWNHYRETGEINYLDNLHTDEYIVKCHWVERARLSPHSCFKFELTRTAKAKITKHLKEDVSAIYKYDLRR